MALQIKDGNGALVNTPLYDAAYSASKPGLVPAATASELVVIQGAAGVIGRIKRILVYGSAGAASYNLLTCELRRWSTAGTLTSAVLTAVPTIGKHSKANATPGLTVSTVGTAAYGAAGTVTGVLWSGRTITPTTTYVAGEVLGPLFDVSWANKGDNPPTVESATDFLVLVATAAVATAILDITIQWEEATV